ncbi:MAG: hypothetical protein JO147_04405 [Actinobacteria bacterium]|nr:hypothetical protein [Actinomycetota bacterium]
MSRPRTRRLAAAVLVGALVSLIPLLLRVTPAAANQAGINARTATAAVTGSRAAAELAVTELKVGGIAVSAVLAFVAGTALLLTVRHRRVAAVAVPEDQPRASEVLDQLLEEGQAD